MIVRRTSCVVALLLVGLAPCRLTAQAPALRPMPAYPVMPAPNGFRLFVLTDMEGIGSVVDTREVIAGNEGERYRTLTSSDYWDRFRGLFTREVNAAIAGARRGGARSFVVNEGHGGNLFANLLPWELDTAALLVRGWPKPMVMTTGLDSSAGAMLMIGMHAGANMPGILSHMYAFDRFTVNGTALNETGINALVASEYGVPVAMVTGDDIMMAQARTQLGDGFVGVVVKYALGRSAAITYSPVVVRRMIADSAAAAARRAVRGDFHPFTLTKPYNVEFTLRHSYPAEYVASVDALAGLTKTGDRSYRLTTNDAREMSRMLDQIERIVLPPFQVPPGPPPAPVVVRDSTPAESVVGVLEAQQARESLQRLMDHGPRAFTVYIIGDMEGLAAVVRNALEMRPEYRGGDAQHQAFRTELTDEINAAIAGARAAGATQFVVNDGHGGTLFRNVLPERLDSTALLIRGYPKPVVMETGLNPDVDAMFMIGAHANAGTAGVIAHSFAFDSFTVNGKVLNESGIAAFLGGAMGVPFALTAGDDIMAAETRDMLGPIETVVTKVATGGSAAVASSPAAVQRAIRDAAFRAVQRVRAGEIRPLALERPYHVRLCVRRTYQDWVFAEVARIPGIRADGGPRCFAYDTNDAESVGTLLNRIEWIVLKP
jgi:D-amino peptidase